MPALQTPCNSVPHAVYLSGQLYVKPKHMPRYTNASRITPASSAVKNDMSFTNSELTIDH